MRRQATAWMVLAAACMAAAQPPFDVHVALEPPVVPWHESAAFSIVVEGSGETEFRIPDMAGKFGDLHVDGPRPSTEILPDGRVRTVHAYTIEPVEPGLYPIEPAIVEWGENGQALIVAPALRVRDLTDEELAALATAAPLAGLFEPPRRTGLYLGGAIAAALLALGTTLWMLRRPQPDRETIETRDPPWEIALARLDALAAQRLPEKGQFGPYYVQVSAILRHYIEDRFAVHAPEQTTPEFLGAARDGDVLNAEHEELLAQFLRHADRVKFARYIPAAPEMRRSMAVVRQFVRDTAGQNNEREAAA